MSSCSSYTFKEMESIANRMGRFESKKHDSLVVPRLPISKTAIIASKEVRYPASVSSNRKVKLVQGFNNKKLYFSTMIQQYVKLQSYTEQHAPQITSCPHFHTTFLKLQEGHIVSSVNKQKWDKHYSSIATQDLVAHNPELALPATYNTHGPRVIDITDVSKKDSVQKALSIYLKKMHRELDQLCQSGTTDNYYTFENLYSSQEISLASASPQSIKVLLKTPVYLNEMLIKSLSKTSKKTISRRIASTEKSRTHNMDIFSEVNKRFKTAWFNTYINQL